MAKKDIGIQLTVIVLGIGFFCWLAFTEFFMKHFPSLDIIIQECKIYFIIFSVLLSFIPLSNLYLQMKSKHKKEYNDKPYYEISKKITLLIFSAVIILIFAVLFIYCYIYLQIWFNKEILSFILSAILTICSYLYLWRWIEKKFGLEQFYFIIYKNN